MARNRCYVEINTETKLPIRILRHFEFKLPVERLAEWPKIEAERAIKRQLLAKQGDQCLFCGATINMSAHLHERKFRSQGGEVSLENSVVICAKCHIGKKGEHKDRFPQW
jgi:5-methylcytosine-specific restriction endonuclease McrA